MADVKTRDTLDAILAQLLAVLNGIGKLQRSSGVVLLAESKAARKLGRCVLRSFVGDGIAAGVGQLAALVLASLLAPRLSNCAQNCTKALYTYQYGFTTIVSDCQVPDTGDGLLWCWWIPRCWEESE